MDTVIFNVLIIFGTLFGIVYVAVSSRTRVRLALIEKGADASIFASRPVKNSNIFSIILVNLSLLLVSVGIGIFLAAILHQSFNVLPEVAYPGTIFTVAGIGLFIGYKLSSKIGRE
ncbi:MAG TPA: DUF6249 domain-containing protein [Hanamia sp.]|nr:DUF6249 domain-containing protein [Hanamia sp.]